MKECIRCGAPLEEGDQFCKKCGAITNANQENGQVNQINEETTNENHSQYNQETNNDFNDFGKTNIEPQQINREESNNLKEVENISETEKNNSNQPKNNGSKNKIFIVIIGMLVVILIGMAIFAAMTVINEKEDETDEPKSKISKNETKDKKENTTKNKTKNDVEDEEDDDEKETNSTKPSNKDEEDETVEFVGYEFTIPQYWQDIKCSVINKNGEDILVLENTEEEWVATVILVENVEFSSFKNNINELETVFASTGMTVGNVRNEKYYGLDVITLENQSDDEFEKILIGLVQTKDKKFFEIDVTGEYIYEYLVLDNIIEMLADSKYTGEITEGNKEDEDNIFEDLEEELKMNTIDLKTIEEKLKAQ